MEGNAQHGPRRPRADDASPSAVAALDDLVTRTANVASRFRSETPDGVATYIESALVTMRLAASMLVTTDGEPQADAPLPVPGNTTVSMAHVAGPVWTRSVMVDGGSREVPNADIGPPVRRGPDLGAALVRSEAAMSTAAGPIGAALLADALSGWSWVNEAARNTWSCTPASGRALVAALNAGAPPVPLGRAMIGRIDAVVLAVLRDIGWSPHPRQARSTPQIR